MDRSSLKISTDECSVSTVPLLSRGKYVHVGDSLYTWNGTLLVWKRFTSVWAKGLTLAQFSRGHSAEEAGMMVIGCKELSSVRVNGVLGKVVKDSANRTRLEWPEE